MTQHNTETAEKELYGYGILNVQTNKFMSLDGERPERSMDFLSDSNKAHMVSAYSTDSDEPKQNILSHFENSCQGNSLRIVEIRLAETVEEEI